MTRVLLLPRSYRVPPKITFVVLQAVLQMAGHPDEDTVNWGQMRQLANFKTIKVPVLALLAPSLGKRGAERQ